jgi:hypothetical protein
METDLGRKKGKERPQTTAVVRAERERRPAVPPSPYLDRPRRQSPPFIDVGTGCSQDLGRMPAPPRCLGEGAQLDTISSPAPPFIGVRRLIC